MRTTQARCISHRYLPVAPPYAANYTGARRILPPLRDECVSPHELRRRAAYPSLCPNYIANEGGGRNICCARLPLYDHQSRIPACLPEAAPCPVARTFNSLFVQCARLPAWRPPPASNLPPAASVPAQAGTRPKAGRGATRELPVMIQYRYANHSQPPIGPAMRPADLILGTCEMPLRSMRPSISKIALIPCEVNATRDVDSAKDALDTPNAARGASGGPRP